MPDNFKYWVIDNAERIERAKERGTLPYFIRNNGQAILEIKERHAAMILDNQIANVMEKATQSGEAVQKIAVSIAQKYDAQCTPINYKSSVSIKRKVFAERQDNPGFLPDQLKDTVKTTIIADKARIQPIINELKK